MQPTAVSRRKYKHRGRGAASYGRRVKDTALKSKMVVTDEDETILHSLPKQERLPCYSLDLTLEVCLTLSIAIFP